MIDDVADLLIEQIDMNLRGIFDRLHKHRYTYSLPVCRATLANNISANYLEYQKKNGFSKAECAQMDLDVETAFGGSLRECFRDCAEKGVKEKMLIKDEIFKIWRSTWKGVAEFQRSNMSGSDGSAISILLKVGTIGAMKEYIDDNGNGTGKYYNLVNNCTKKLYSNARTVAFKEFARYCEHAAARMKGGSGDTTMREAKGKVTPVKAHGEAMEVFAGQVVGTDGEKMGIVRPKGTKNQTTVAVLAMARNFEQMKATTADKTYSEEITNKVTVARDMITNYLENRYQLAQYRTADKWEFNEEVVVHIHATDPKGNKDFQEGNYDRPGIEKNIKAFVEREVKPALLKGISKKTELAKWTEMSGSTPRGKIIENQVKKNLIEQILKIKGTRPDFRLKVNKRLLKQANKDAKVRKKSKEKAGKRKAKTISKGIVLARAATDRTKKRRRAAGTQPQSKVAQSPVALRNLLNEALPQQVAMNMGSPALNYRTGRFANSARVQMVTQGPRGGTEVDYTYMKNPYQTFEPGFKQGSTMRDPRKIIGESIREIATAILGRQPHTIRRV